MFKVSVALQILDTQANFVVAKYSEVSIKRLALSSVQARGTLE